MNCFTGRTDIEKPPTAYLGSVHVYQSHLKLIQFGTTWFDSGDSPATMRVNDSTLACDAKIATLTKNQFNTALKRVIVPNRLVIVTAGGFSKLNLVN